LSKQPGRFSELNRAIAGASERMLAKQLKELQTDGLISKQEQEGVQVYTLTEFGQSLQPVLETILRWGLANYNRS
jgi:DNA-binding HxlR family transcriptional regulator